MLKKNTISAIAAAIIAAASLPLAASAGADNGGSSAGNSSESATDSSKYQIDPQAPTPAATHKLTFLDPSGKVLAEFSVNEGETIDYSKVDTSSLRKHLNVFTEEDFYMWDSSPETVTKDTTFRALMKTAVIKKESIPKREKYASVSGKIDLEGLKISIVSTYQTPEKDKEGKYLEKTVETDITASCAAKPATLDEAFAKSDKATISIYPIGQDKSIASFNISTVGAIGDADGDGTVDGSDATAILKYFGSVDIAGYKPTEALLKHGDIDGDGTIDGSDATLALRYYGLANNGEYYPIEKFLDERGIQY